MSNLLSLLAIDASADAGGAQPHPPAKGEEQPTNLVVPVFLSAIPCEHEAVDAPAGLLSAQRIYFALNADRFPHPVQLMVLSFWWFQELGEASLGVRLMTPDGEQLAALSDPAVVESVPTFYSHRVRFSDPGRPTIALPEPGTYRIEVWAGGRAVGAYPLVVTQTPSPGEDAEPILEENAA